ncbi:M48 family metallopeptidase [Nostocoides vanveenii]|uniref:M48 family metallopeptidase n=1 Tax=Nostocoides vanveenii TaxID=330835 RepID=A0ABN2KK31_9MICO
MSLHPPPPPGYAPVDPVADDPGRAGRRRTIRAALRHPLENFALVVAVLVSVVILISCLVAVIRAFRRGETPDPYVLLFALAPLVLWFMRGQLMAKLRLNGVKVTPTQYPEAYAMVQDAASAFGLKRVPDAYVVLGNGMINAAASGHGFRRFIFIYSDLFEVGGRLKNPDALRFIIGHEVGHIAAGHTSYWRWLGIFGANIVPIIGPALSRSQEFTADNFGYAYCAHGSAPAMSVLAAGKYLNETVDINAIADRAESEKGFFVWTVNAMSSHPVLAWRAHALRDRSAPGRLLWRPRAPKGMISAPPGPERASILPPGNGG